MHRTARELTLLCCSVTLCVGAWAASGAPGKEPVRAGCEVDYAPYCMARDGVADGFSVELLRAALKAMQRDVTFTIGDAPGLRQDLADGILQVLPVLARSAEREDLYDFTFPYVTMQSAIIVRNETHDIASVASLSRRHVIVTADGSAEEYLQRANVGAIVSTRPSFAQALKELSAGKCDAVVMQKFVALQIMHQSRLTNLKIVGPAIPEIAQSFCFAVRNGDSTLLSDLNEGLSIVMADGTFQQLYGKWLSSISMIRPDEPLIVGCEGDFAPFTSGHSESDVDGFAVELWKHVARERGLPYRLSVKPWWQLVEDFKNEKVDVLVCAASSIERRQFARFSVTHSSDQGAIFVRDNETRIHSESDLEGKSIAVFRGDLTHEYAVMRGWEKQLVIVEQPSDGFNQLASGKCDAMLISKLAGMQVLKHNRIVNVHPLPARTGVKCMFAFAVHRDDLDLLAALNEGLAACKADGSYDKTYEKWLGVYDNHELRFSELLWLLWPYLALLVIVLLSLTVGILYLRQIERRRAEKALRESESRYRALFEQCGDFITLLEFGAGEEPVILDANTSMLQAHGYSREELVGKPISTIDVFISPEDIRKRSIALDSGELATFAVRHRRKDGSELELEVRAQVITLGGRRVVFAVERDVTERNRADALLRASEQRSRMLFDAAPVSLWEGDFSGPKAFFDELAARGIADIEAHLLSHPEAVEECLSQVRILNVNRATVKLFEARDTAELLGRWRSLLTTESIGVLIKGYAALHAGQLSFCHDVRCQTLNGQPRTVLLELLPAGADRSWSQMLVSLVDITERKRAEEDLEAEIAHRRMIFELSPDGIVIVDPKTTGFVEFNTTAHLQLGYSREEFARLRLRDVEAQDTLEQTEQRIQAIIRDQRVDFETTHRTRQGEILSIFVTAQLRNVHGKEVLQCVWRDITTRNRAEAALRESEERFRQLANNTNEVFWIASANLDQIFYANPAYERLWGRSIQTLYDNPLSWVDAVHPEDRERVHAGFLSQGDLKSAFEAEYRVVRPDSTVRWVLDRAVPVRDAQGRVFRMAGIVTDITARRHVEDALRETTRFLEESQRIARAGWYALDIAGGTWRCSGTLQEIFGIVGTMYPQDVGGWVNLVHPDERTAMRYYFYTHVMKNHQAFDREYRIVRHNDQAERWVHGRGEVILDSHGNSVSMIGLIQDITDRKLAEAASRQSEIRYRIVADHTYDWESWRAPDGTYLYVSPSCERITGYDPERFKRDPKFLFEIIHAEDKAAFATHLDAIDAERVVAEMEYRIVRADGGIRWIYRLCRPIFDDNGAYLGARSSDRDITERKQAEAALEQEHAFSSAIIAAAANGICVCNATPAFPFVTFTVWNQRMTELTGYDMDEINRLGWYQTLYPDPELQAQAASRMNRMRHGEDMRGEEWQITRKDGARRTLSISTSLIRKGSGETHVLAILHDVTERKLMENKLHHAQKMEAVGHLAGGIAHDFNNQLNVILGFGEMALQKTDSPVLKKYLTHIVNGADRSAHLVRQLLTFSRRGDYTVQRVDIHSVISEVKSMLKRTLDKRITLTSHLDAPAHIVMGDPALLYNAFLNLALNARDAMPNGGELSFSTAVVDSGLVEALTPDGAARTACLQIVVRDTGHGMSDEVQKRIFEPFFTTKGPGKGTGLGLASVYGTINRHAGGIDVKSKPGAGACFTITLPLSEPDPAVTAETQQPVLVQSRPGTSVLIVDDEDNVAAYVANALNELGCHTVIKSDGLSALEYYRENWQGIDAIVLDMNMPRMNGAEAFEAMRQINPGARILLSTGYSNEAGVQNLLRAGAAGFLAKPYRPADIAHELSRILGRQ